jgi:uncharacterized Zn-binding protein involved in type VI secretion
MPGICRDNDTCGPYDLVPSQSSVYVNNELVIVNGDIVGAPPHSTLSATGNSTVSINGKLICVAGDRDSDDHVAVGSSTVSIG